MTKNVSNADDKDLIYEGIATHNPPFLEPDSRFLTTTKT